jgi:8-oxo-dGTP pyrophosphatase MutT (NUDIX family)
VTNALHRDAHATLSRWTPPNAEQERLRGHYLAYLAGNADAMQRTCRPAHLTASVLLVSPDHSRALLTLHKRLGRWLQTGGHCEGHDATLADAALREGTEEGGISQLSLDPVPVVLSAHEVPACGDSGPATHLDVQYVAVAAHTAWKISEESDRLAWVDMAAHVAGRGDYEIDDSVRTLMEYSMKRLQEIP